MSVYCQCGRVWQYTDDGRSTLQRPTDSHSYPQEKQVYFVRLEAVSTYDFVRPCARPYKELAKPLSLRGAFVTISA